MRHSNRIKKFGRKKNQRGALMRSLAQALIKEGKIKTTEAKAKTVRPLVEKIITLAVKGGLNSRRELISLLPQPMAVKKAMEVLSVKYKDRRGGYLRIIRLNSRLGDNAKMAQIELV